MAVNRAWAEPPCVLTTPGTSRMLRTPSWAFTWRSGPASPERGAFTLTLSMAA